MSLTPPPSGPRVAALPVAVSASALLHAGVAGLLLLVYAPKLVEPQTPPQSRMTVEAYQVDRSEAAEARPETEAAAEDRPQGALAEQGAVPQSRAEPAALSPEAAAAETPAAEAVAAAEPEAAALAPAEAAPEAVRPAPPAADRAEAAAPEATRAEAASPAPEQAEAAAPEAAAARVEAPRAEAAAPVPAAAAPAAVEAPEAEAVAAAAPPAEAAAPVAARTDPVAASATPAPVVVAAVVASPAPVAATPAVPAPAPAAEIAAPVLAAAAPEAPALAPAAPATEAAPAAPPPADAAPATPPQAQDAPAAAPQTDAAPDRTQGASEPLPDTPPPAEKGKATLAPVGPDGELDPKSLEAIQAFMQPGDAAAAASEVRDGIEGLLASVPCARLQVEFDPDTGTLALRGHIPEEGLQAPVLAALQAQIGEGIPVEADLRILPRPQCGALSGIADVGLPQSTDQTSNPRIVGDDSYAREFSYKGGDRLTFDLNAPDYDAYVYVDYFDAGGNVIHLIPNDRIALSLTPAKTPLDVGQKREGQPYLDITIGPPYGQEIAVAFAASVPLYDGLRPFVEPADAYLAELKQRVAEARAADPSFKGEWVYFFISTSE
ncbi:DUF4384 domain-containing protein [Frigidibacter sp. ROC022]|uniref:DUF4384 domain-containing protein n=1 Tax=Frigidibacter sp. ROC022 TaxID=2971796 RepID=UPI00215A801F|nr:DUF4384 domain-containing protein [Frigidibacter sp. ROC022]MCR8723318.1 DUF4384 domain-containing protein [Frigidibacter sp. ROC022]